MYTSKLTGQRECQVISVSDTIRSHGRILPTWCFFVFKVPKAGTWDESKEMAGIFKKAPGWVVQNNAYKKHICKNMFAIPELQVLGRIHNFMNNIQYEHFASLSIYIYI